MRVNACKYTYSYKMCEIIFTKIKEWMWKTFIAKCNVVARKSLLTSRASVRITKRLSLPSPLLLIASWMYSTPRALVTRCNVGNNNFSESLSRGDNDRWTMRQGQCARGPENGSTGWSYIMYCAASRTCMQREPYRINIIVCYWVLLDSIQVYLFWLNSKLTLSELSIMKYMRYNTKY